jgi:hypothetical protein
MTLMLVMNLGFAWGPSNAATATHHFYRLGLGFAYT